MPSALRFREDHSAEEVRALARRSKDVNQSRRLPSLAAVRDGMDRGSAAKIGGIDRQTLRSCVRMIPGEKLRQSIGRDSGPWLISALDGGAQHPNRSQAA